MVTAGKILEVIPCPIILDEQPDAIGASVGIALYPAHGAEPAGLLRCADAAMYQAKREQLGYALYNLRPGEKSSSRIAVVSTS